MRHARMYERRWIGRAAALALALAARSPAAVSGDAIEYIVRLDAPQTQMVGIEMRVPDVRGTTLEVALPVWRPGRYEVLDSAGAVRDVAATDGAGRALAIEKIDKSTWRIATAGADEVRIAYRVYCNELGSRTRHVDDTHAFLSGSSVFFYVPERRDGPVRVRLDAPAAWKVACGMEHEPGDPRNEDRTLLAPNYDVLIDSPIEVGRHDLIEFEVDGVPHEIAIWGEADEDAEKLKRDFAKIIRAQAAIFGGLPYERYVFLVHAGAGAGGGTEHLNSTIMQTSRASLEDDAAYKRFLGLVSHEFFHTWNVKRLRPAGIQPYDFARENYTKLLWVCEGTTSYYDDLTLARTGLKKANEYLKSLAEAIGNMRDRPGTAVQSLEESSFDAWIKFNATTPDSVNSTVSFYSNGALVSMALDMELRRRTNNAVSLDALMRAMYERFPLGGGGYTPEDLVTVAGELSGGDFDPFFASHMRGTEVPDFQSLLATVGLELTFKPAKKDKVGEDEEETADEIDSDADAQGESEEVAPAETPVKAYLGLNLSSSAGGASVRAVLADGPAYTAGIMAGDEIVAMNGRRLPAGDLDKRLEKYKPGDTVTLHIMRRDELRTFEVTLAGRPDGTWALQRIKAPSEQQIAAYESWIGQEWPAKDKEAAAQQQPAPAPSADD